jgi:hypothetical protein
LAVVAIESRSEPAFGSVMQMAPIFSPRSAGLNRRSMMSSLPKQVQELGAHQRLHGHGAGQRHRAARDFLQGEAELGQRRTAAADFFGIAHAEEAEVGQFLEQGARILLAPRPAPPPAARCARRRSGRTCRGSAAGLRSVRSSLFQLAS